jgi:hypothetical protein
MSTTNITGSGQTTRLAGGGNRESAVGYQITGTFVGTISFEGTIDGSTFVPVAAVPAAVMPYGTPVTSATAPGIWTVYSAGFMGVRARCSAYTSGTAVITDQPTG